MRVAVIHNRDREGVINVFGPQNRERYNPKTVERVATALEHGGHNVRVMEGNMHLVDQLRDFMPRVIAGERPGMVFNMAYGIQGVSRYTHIPAMLEMLGVPYVGSGPMAHGLALDKVIAKIVFQSAHLPTPGFWNFASPDDRFDDIRFPVIVKPKMEAVSYGIQVVEDAGTLREAVAAIIEKFQQHVLVEEFIPGREFAVGLLGNDDPEILPIVEIDFGGDPRAIQTATDKLRRPLGKLCPAALEPEKAEELRSLVRRAFNSLGLFDFARVDLRMGTDGRFHILEINSMASLGLTGTYVHAAGVAGYSYEDLINRMLEVAAVRYFGSAFRAETAPKADKAAARSEKLSARVRSYLRSQQPTIEDALRTLVGMRSPATDVERVNALGDWVSAQFRTLGFEREVIPLTDYGNPLYFRNHDESECDVLLLGHLDSAVSQAPFIPFRVEGNRCYGTGIAEHKGGLAVALGAIRALRFARTARRIRCGVLLTTDDTVNGTHGRHVVERFARDARVVLGLKAGEVGGGVVVSRSGRATYRAEVRYPRRDVTARDTLRHLTRRLSAMHDLSDEIAGLRVEIRRVELDAPFGMRPTAADAVVTVRFNRPEDGPRVEEELRLLARRPSSKGLRLEIAGRIRRPPLVRGTATDRVYEDVARIAQRINVPAKPVHRWHSSDICFVPAAIPAVDGMGPVGGGERTPEEHVVRSSLVERAALLALVMHARARRPS